MADFNSDRQGDARRAYGDAEQSRLVHGKMMETFNVDIRRNGAMRNRAMVLGGLAGLCTAASAIALARGAPQFFRFFMESNQSAKVLTYALTSGLGLAFCATVSCVNEREVYDLELKRELWEIDNHLSGELLEMISIYRNQGLTEEEATVVTRIFSRQKHLFAELMMVEELGYSRLEPPTLSEVLSNAALPAVAGYVTGLATPVLPLLLISGRPGTQEALATPEGAEAISRTLNRISVAVLSTAATGLSVLQSEVFFGAYACRRIMFTSVAINAIGIGTLYAISYTVAKLL